MTKKVQFINVTTEDEESDEVAVDIPDSNSANEENKSNSGSN